jgi:hypothetical protein
MDVKIEENVGPIWRAHDKVSWLSLVNTIIFLGLYMAKNLLASWATVSFFNKTMSHKVS